VPSALAGQLSDPVLFIGIWLLGATVAGLGANCVAELAVMLPKAGGPYVYVQRAYGDYAGFVMGWVDWFVSVGSAAFILVALGEYGLRLIPNFPGGTRCISLLAIALLFLVHAVGLRSGSTGQKLLSTAKALGFMAIVVLCLAWAPSRTAAASAPSTPSHVPLWAILFPLSRAAVMVNETYAGWNSPVYLTEENLQPERSIPRALFGGIAIVAIIYLLTNVALLNVLPLDQIAHSNLPLADAIGLIVGPVSAQIVTVLAIVTLLSLCHANLFQAPRILFALARDGWFHSAACSVTQRGALLPGLTVSVAAMIFLAMTGTFEELFVSIALLSMAFDAFVFSSVLRLRRTEPDLPRAFRAKCYPWLPLLVVFYVVAVVLAAAWTDPASTVRGILVLVCSAPAFLWLKSRRTPAERAAAAA